MSAMTIDDVSRELRRLERYAPRGLRLRLNLTGEIVEHQELGDLVVAYLHAPGHPVHASIAMRLEIKPTDGVDDLALTFHRACEQWLEWVR